MPMFNDNNFIWRSNDNGSVTNLRYSIEAEKWVNAVNTAQNKLPKGNYGADLGFIGSVLALPFLLIFFIFMIPIVFIKEVIGFNIKLLPGDEPTGWLDKWGNVIPKAKVQVQKRRVRKPGDEIPTRFEDMTQEDIQRVVQMVRAETARANS